MPPYEKVLMKYDMIEERLLTEILKPTHKSLSKIKSYLTQNIDINKAERYGNNALHHAAKLGRRSVLEMLVKAGGDPTKTNHSGQTALIIASNGTKRGHSSCVKFLIQNGCNVNSTDHEGRTALRQAILASNVKSVDLLLQFGSDLSWEEHSKLCSNENNNSVAFIFASSINVSQPGVMNHLPQKLRNMVSPNEKIKSLIYSKIHEELDEVDES